MSASSPTLPEAGGSYVRDPDGTLRPAPVPVSETPAAKGAVKAPAKTPVKES